MLIYFEKRGIFMGLWTMKFFWGVIPWFLFFATFSYMLANMLKGKDKAKTWILRGIAIAILVLEVAKQTKNLLNPDGYSLYALPFHYCSLFLLILPLHSFARGKFKKLVDGISFATLSSLFFVYIVVPTVLYPDSNFKTYFTSFGSFHTITFHHLVVLYLFLAIAFRAFDLKIKRDFPIIATFLSVFVIISTFFSYTLNTNYHNLLKSNVDIIEDLVRVPLNNALGGIGQAIYVGLMFVFTTVIAYAGYALISIFYNLVIVRKKKQKSK